MKDGEDFSFLFRDLMLYDFVVRLIDKRKNGEDGLFFCEVVSFWTNFLDF